jgi:hypothetical protein
MDSFLLELESFRYLMEKQTQILSMTELELKNLRGEQVQKGFKTRHTHT